MAVKKRLITTFFILLGIAIVTYLIVDSNPAIKRNFKLLWPRFELRLYRHYRALIPYKSKARETLSQRLLKIADIPTEKIESWQPIHVSESEPIGLRKVICTTCKKATVFDVSWQFGFSRLDSTRRLIKSINKNLDGFHIELDTTHYCPICNPFKAENAEEQKKINHFRECYSYSRERTVGTGRPQKMLKMLDDQIAFISEQKNSSPSQQIDNSKYIRRFFGISSDIELDRKKLLACKEMVTWKGISTGVDRNFSDINILIHFTGEPEPTKADVGTMCLVALDVLTRDFNPKNYDSNFPIWEYEGNLRYALNIR